MANEANFEMHWWFPEWTESEVLEFYENNHNLTLRELADLSGWSVEELQEFIFG